MDYTEILAFAKSRLGAEFNYVVQEIELRVRSGSTGSEIGSLVGGYLKILRDQSHPAYLTLKAELDFYLSQFKFNR